MHGNVSTFAQTNCAWFMAMTANQKQLYLHGHVNALQEGNNTKAEKITYYFTSRRLQATGNVRSRMIQQKPNGNTQHQSRQKNNQHSPNSNTTAGAATAASCDSSSVMMIRSLFCLMPRTSIKTQAKWMLWVMSKSITRTQ